MHLSDRLPRRTARLTLRPLTPADLADFQAYRHDPQVGRYQGWSPWPDADAAAFLGTMQALDALPPHDWRQIGVATADGRLIGDVAFHVTEDGACAGIGFTLARQAHGRGLGREAVAALIALVFDASSVRCIVAVTDVRNDAARRLLAAVGMTVVAIDEAEFRGERCREETFAIARPPEPADG